MIVYPLNLAHPLILLDNLITQKACRPPTPWGLEYFCFNSREVISLFTRSLMGTDSLPSLAAAHHVGRQSAENPKPIVTQACSPGPKFSEALIAKPRLWDCTRKDEACTITELISTSGFPGECPPQGGRTVPSPSLDLAGYPLLLSQE